jgi:hypothetical protein
MADGKNERARGRPDLTPDYMKELIQESGYLLELRVQEVFRQAGWWVSPNEAYPDPQEQKSREIDLVADSNPPKPNEHVLVFMRLVVECINNGLPLVFFTPPRGDAFAPLDCRSDIKMVGWPNKVPTPVSEGELWDLEDALDFKTYHHYCRDDVATQWCTFTPFGDRGWKVEHSSLSFGCIQSLCNATDHFLGGFGKARLARGDAWLFFLYPLIVTQGHLFTCSGVSPHSVTVSPTDRVRFRRSVASGAKYRTYSIDVVSEAGLPGLIEMINAEMASVTDDLAAKMALPRRRPRRPVH